MNIETLKELGDSLKNKHANIFIFFVSRSMDSDKILFMAGKEAVARKVNSNELLKKVSVLLNGRGGGKPDMAQGSANEKNKYKEALEIINAEDSVLGVEKLDEDAMTITIKFRYQLVEKENYIGLSEF